ncbi:MAG: hypothetical protein IPG44_11670 [Anaerolineales bacterium]|nr:hypothetical protein [Anaerolineales bacterium]
MQTLGFGGLAIDVNDNVFVVDNENHRVSKSIKTAITFCTWQRRHGR